MHSWTGEEKEPPKKRKWPVDVQGRRGQICPEGEEDSECVRVLGEEEEDTYCQSDWSY